jgi:uncharacterized sodium:solute symporter family permease YidK
MHSITDFLFGLACFVCFMALIFNVRKEWQVPPNEGPGPAPDDWPFGRPSWIAYRLMSVPLVLAALSFALILVPAGLGESKGTLRTVAIVLVATAGFSAAVIGGFGRPKWLVPPSLRAEPGFAVEVALGWWSVGASLWKRLRGRS